MIKKGISSALLMIFVLLFVGVSFGQTEPLKKKSDDRVEMLLLENKLEYEIDIDGDFRITFAFDDGRSHLVFVNSDTYSLGSLEVREVWAVGYVKKDMSSAAMRKLLTANSTVISGAWSISKYEKKESAIFSVQMVADTDKESMMAILKLVSETADNMEKELSGKDDL